MQFRLILILILLANQVLSQRETWVEARGKVGFLVAHRSVMGHLAREHSYATELSLMFRGNGEQQWHDEYNNPMYGFSIFYGSTGNRELMGNYLGGYGFVSFPFIHKGGYSFCGRLGAGIGYAPKVWDLETNNLSIGVSTHVNALVSMGLENRFEFGNHGINCIVDMTHFSNGSMKVPNFGLNLPYVSFGYSYRIKESDTSLVNKSKPFEPYWEFGAIGYASMQEVFPVGGRKYPLYGLNAVARRYFKPTVGMEVSFDFFHKQSTLTFHEDVPKTQSEIMQLGAFVGYLLPMNHFHLVVGMGYYVRDKFQPQDPFYHRVGMRYVFDKGLNLNLVLKSHWARADYIEFGLGYTFKR